jgi:hypothetical protein
MKRNSATVGQLVLAAAGLALPSWVSAAPPTGAPSYFCSGHGDIILMTSAGPCDADVAMSSDILSNIVVPTCTSHPVTVKAPATVAIKSGACGIPLSTTPGISCDFSSNLTVKPNCTFAPPFPNGGPRRLDLNFTVTSVVPTPIIIPPGHTTPAAICQGFLGSNFDAVAYVSADQRAFDYTTTHSESCIPPAFPCPPANFKDAFTPVVDIQCHDVTNSVAP